VSSVVNFEISKTNYNFSPQNHICSVGNLYYALTHSPEPMDDEYLRALSWEAATERLEAAGSVPVKEAELMKEALSSEDAGIEVGQSG